MQIPKFFTDALSTLNSIPVATLALLLSFALSFYVVYRVCKLVEVKIKHEQKK